MEMEAELDERRIPGLEKVGRRRKEEDSSENYWIPVKSGLLNLNG